MSYKYLVVIEKSESGYSAYSPDVPGCVATGKTADAVEAAMSEAIEFHLEGLVLAGEAVPQPQAQHAFAWVKTSSKAVSQSSQTLAGGSTKASKRASGSALSQTGKPKKTSTSAATAASKTLGDGRASTASKSAAGSSLSQKHGSRGGKKK